MNEWIDWLIEWLVDWNILIILFIIYNIFKQKKDWILIIITMIINYLISLKVIKFKNIKINIIKIFKKNKKWLIDWFIDWLNK